VIFLVKCANCIDNGVAEAQCGYGLGILQFT
jgi:hypothetical protein